MTYSPLTIVEMLESAIRDGDQARAARGVAMLRSGLRSDSAERTCLTARLASARALLRELSARLGECSHDRELSDLLGDLSKIPWVRGVAVGAGTAEAWTIVHELGPLRSSADTACEMRGSPIIEQVLRTGRHWPVVDDGQASAAGVDGVIGCLPLLLDGAAEGFVCLRGDAGQDVIDPSMIEVLADWLSGFGHRLVQRAELPAAPVLAGVVTRSATLRTTLAELHQLAGFDASLLLSGETGTGKSLIARRVHAASARADGPFVHLNCGAIPQSLLEGELFGAEAGAYTGLQRRRIGRFEAACGGTLFLDELESMPLECQAKLLVALQERTITRLGSNTEVPVDVRVIAATSTDPRHAIAQGNLREDLYYRVAVFAAHLPPLRERPEDILLLSRVHLRRICDRYDLGPMRIAPGAERALLKHPWPGNVRELENTLERSALLAIDGLIVEVRLDDSVVPAGRVTGSSGTIGHLQRAAAALVQAMLHRPELRDLALVGVFRGALLIELVRRTGTADEAFRFLGEHDQVRARNHTRVLRREVGRLERLAGTLGEWLDEEPD